MLVCGEVDLQKKTETNIQNTRTKAFGREVQLQVSKDPVSQDLNYVSADK